MSLVVKRMRAILAPIVALVLLGCATEERVKPYVYSPPVVVAFKSLQHTNGYYVAVFKMTNVSSEPMWFDGEIRHAPACCIEYKSVPVAEHSKGEMGYYWGDTGLSRYQLASGESMDFHIVRREFTGPFRAGVWLSAEADNKTMDDLIYWSDYVSP